MSSSSAYHPSRPVLSAHHSDYHQHHHHRHHQQQPQSHHTQPPLDHRRSFHGIIDSNRLPLRDTTGNGQSSYHSSVVNCYPPNGILSPSSMPSSSSHNALTLPPPPQAHHAPSSILPSQSFDSLQRIQRPPPPPLQRFGQVQPRGKSRASINPLYFWQAFKQYRNRQAHKDVQKDKGGVWRRTELEDAFVDSVLLMPHMGRRKFSMGGKLHGRNMLISEYIFVICVQLLGSKEIFRIDNSNDSIEQMGRKQVSSHMQVVKKFFDDLRCFHFLFPAEDKKEPGTTNSDDYYDDEEQESFKANPVLTALAEGRVPDVKPNYEYFSQLLALQSSITIRPKAVEIFVSSPDVKIKDDVAYDANDEPLSTESFPHLAKHLNSGDRSNVLGKDVLLHEYTRSIDSSTSACVKTVTRRWQKDAPALYETLDLPTRDEDCLLVEMCSTVDLHKEAKFPSGSELTGFVEVSVTLPHLQHHRWKCVTKLTRPAELDPDDSKPEVYVNESGIHHPGCNDSKPNCDCHHRPRANIHVPFPAVEWASLLSTAVQYPDVEHERKKAERAKSSGAERTSSKRKRGSEDEGDAAEWARREYTGSDLMCKVAMYQELWSCADDQNGKWTRQAIIFWRFSTTNQWYKYNPVFRPAGTVWRWLTVNDPMSKYHQSKALIYPNATAQRDAVMSPTPSVSQHITAAMNETFSSAWDGSSLSAVPGSNSMGNMFDGFSSGLATPPPSASLHGSYSASGSFDATNGFLPSSTCASEPQSLVASHSAPQTQYFDSVATSYISGSPPQLDLSTQLPYDAGAHHHQPSSAGGLQGWDMGSLEGWSAPPTAPPSVTPTGSDWSAGPGKEWSAAAPGKMDAPPSIWNNVQWREDASPRPVKRRRGDGLDGIPVTAGW